VILNGEYKEINGTVKSAGCMQQSFDGSPLFRNQCSACVALKNDPAFVARIKTAQRAPSKYCRLSALSRSQLEQRATEQARQISALTKVSIRREERRDLDAERARLPVPVQRVVDGLSAANFDPDVDLGDQGAVVDVIQSAVSNMRAKGLQGRRHKEHDRALQMYEVLLYRGGPRIMKFLATNLYGPMTSATVHGPLGKVPVYKAGLAGSREVMPALVRLFKDTMKPLGIPLGQVPFELSEDETNIKPEVSWNPITDELEGFCGRLGECPEPNKCKCDLEHHRCEDNFRVSVGPANTAFDAIVHWFEVCRVGSYARVIMINPLHPHLPKVPVFISCTCNRFSHVDVQFQWDALDALCAKCNLVDVLGPCVGHASDGDDRRRKLMLADLTGNFGLRIKPDTCAGFVMSGFHKKKHAATRNGHGKPPDVTGHGQDYVHNGKKMVNPLDIESKVLMLGEHWVTIGHLLLVQAFFSPLDHKCAGRDFQRKDRQNWVSAQRLFKTPVLKCLQKLHEKHKVPCLGTLCYLRMVNRYVSIFYSATLTLLERIKLASYVLHFLARWRMWVIRSKTHTVASAFISREAYQDMLISCHQVILVVRLFRDYCPGVPVYLRGLGSDCCEQFFSEHGSWVVNKREYTVSEMTDATRKMVRLFQIKCNPSDGPNWGQPTRDRKPAWHGEDPADTPDANLSDYGTVTDAAIGRMWNEGDTLAEADLAALGMVPVDATHRGGCGWWRSLQCPKLGKGGAEDPGYGSGGDDSASSAASTSGSSDSDSDDPDGDVGIAEADARWVW
jgi:hypothetical protein